MAAANMAQSTSEVINIYKDTPDTPPNTPLLYVKISDPNSVRSKKFDSPHACHTPLPFASDPEENDIQADSLESPARKARGRCSRPKPPNFLGLAILVTLCNCPLGVLATIFACLSAGDYSRGDLVGARSKGQVAKWLSIIGFVSAVLIAVMVAMYFLVIERNIVRTYEELLGG